MKRRINSLRGTIFPTLLSLHSCFHDFSVAMPTLWRGVGSMWLIDTLNLFNKLERLDTKGKAFLLLFINILYKILNTLKKFHCHTRHLFSEFLISNKVECVVKITWSSSITWVYETLVPTPGIRVFSTLRQRFFFFLVFSLSDLLKILRASSFSSLDEETLRVAHHASRLQSPDSISGNYMELDAQSPNPTVISNLVVLPREVHPFPKVVYTVVF